MRIKTAVTILVLFLSAEIFADVLFPYAEVSVDKESIEIGETVNVKAELVLPSFAKLLDKEEYVDIDGWDIKDISFKRDFREPNKYIVNLEITTFDPYIKYISPIRFSYISRDVSDADISEDRFYLFSKPVPLNIKNIFEDDTFDNIRDIKSPKKFILSKYIYLLLFLFVAFVLFFVYRDLFLKEILINTQSVSLSAKEIAVRDINNILNSEDFSVNSMKDYYSMLSHIFKKFIMEKSGVSKKEMTTSEILGLISQENSCFFDSFKEINKLFKDYDYAKFAGSMVDDKNFVNTFVITKKIIERY